MLIKNTLENSYTSKLGKTFDITFVAKRFKFHDLNRRDAGILHRFARKISKMYGVQISVRLSCYFLPFFIQYFQTFNVKVYIYWSLDFVELETFHKEDVILLEG